MACHIKQAVKVGIDGALPLVDRKIFKGTLWAGDACIVHQKIEALMLSGKHRKGLINLMGV